jgi:hypothetical protein
MYVPNQPKLLELGQVAVDGGEVHRGARSDLTSQMVGGGRPVSREQRFEHQPASGSDTMAGGPKRRQRILQRLDSDRLREG